jgi:hypothetical protein
VGVISLGAAPASEAASAVERTNATAQGIENLFIRSTPRREPAPILSTTGDNPVSLARAAD